MKIITIIISAITACGAGYVFRMGIDWLKEEDIAIRKPSHLSIIPEHVWSAFACSIFYFIISIVILYVSLESPV